MAKKTCYKPKAEDVKRLKLALQKFKATKEFEGLPDEYKKHLYER